MLFVASPAAMASLARRLAASLPPPPFTVLLDGCGAGPPRARVCSRRMLKSQFVFACRPVGVGKSVFARSFVRTLMDDDKLSVASPSFLLDNAYQTREGHEMCEILSALSVALALARAVLCLYVCVYACEERKRKSVCADVLCVCVSMQPPHGFLPAAQWCQRSGGAGSRNHTRTRSHHCTSVAVCQIGLWLCV